MDENYQPGNQPELLPDDDLQQEEEFSLTPIKPGISPVAAAFIGLFGGFFLYQFVGGLITILIFGMDLEKAPVNAMRLMTMGGQVLFILLPALLFTKWFYVDITRIMRIKLPDIREISLFTLGIVIITPLIQYYIIIQNFYIEKLAKYNPTVNAIKNYLDELNKLVEKTYVNLITANNAFEGMLIVLVIAFVPAICEEAMFRGFIQRSFEFKVKPFWAAFITAVFFGVYHFNPYALIPLVGLGFYFGYAAYTSNSIFIPVFLHFLNNFTAVMVYFTLGEKDLLENTASTNVDLHSTVVRFFVLLVLFAGVIFLIKRYYKRNSWRKNASMS